MAVGKGDLGIDKQGAFNQGKRLEDAATDLDHVVHKDLPTHMKDGGKDSRFGDFGADRAVPRFVAAWSEETKLLGAAFRELHGKIGDGVAATSGTDQGAADGMHRAGQGGSLPGPGPTPPAAGHP